MAPAPRRRAAGHASPLAGWTAVVPCAALAGLLFATSAATAGHGPAHRPGAPTSRT